MKRRERLNGRVVLFEIQQIGNSLRVAALDPVTRTEVTIIADPRETDAHIKRVAARKLFYMIDKHNKKQNEPS